MNKDCMLLFRSNLQGIEDYIEKFDKVKDYRRSYLANHIVKVNNERYVYFHNMLTPKKVIDKALRDFDKQYSYKYDRGYPLERVVKSNNKFYLGFFPKDLQYSTVIDSDLYGEEEEPFRIQVIEERFRIESYSNGSIVYDLLNDIKYFYDNKDIDFLLNLKRLVLNISTVASINRGVLKKNEEYFLLDGCKTNRMSDNLCKGRTCDKDSTKYQMGYITQPSNSGCDRLKFIPAVKIGSRYYQGRVTDNEPEAVMEASLVEKRYASSSVFNPVTHREGYEDLIESYIKGRLTPAGVMTSILTDVASNPFLVLRYNLVDLCRKYCIEIAPFRLDKYGYMVNDFGTRYSDLASERYKNNILI